MGNRRRTNPFCDENELNVSCATISVQFSDPDAYINLSVPKRRGLWPAIMLLLQELNFEIVNATLTTSSNADFHCIHAQIPDGSNIDSEELHCTFEALIVEQLGILACRG